jgi:hypothetical protein
MADDEEPDDPDEPATEPDRAWRERMQETNELAEELAPPHERDDERGSPAPNP